MNKSGSQQIKDTFVSAARVVPRQSGEQRSGQRLSKILRAEDVILDPSPVQTAPSKEKIRIVPIIENGRVKALRAICACGSESIYDIDYAESEVSV
jgi:hypothetical protein